MSELKREVRDFLEAVQQGDRDRVETMLAEDGSLAGARDARGVSVLMVALYHRQEEVAEILRGQKARLDFFEAAAMGDLPAMEVAMSEAPEALSRRSPDGFTALHYAAFFSREEAARFLIEAGSPLEEVADNPTGVHPLHSAVAAGAAGIVGRLLTAGADPNSRQQGGFTPLMGAAVGGHREIVRLLLDQGAEPAAESDDGKSAAMHAASHGHEELAAMLTAG